MQSKFVFALLLGLAYFAFSGRIALAQTTIKTINCTPGGGLQSTSTLPAAGGTFTYTAFMIGGCAGESYAGGAGIVNTQQSSPGDCGVPFVWTLTAYVPPLSGVSSASYDWTVTEIGEYSCFGADGTFYEFTGSGSIGGTVLQTSAPQTPPSCSGFGSGNGSLGDGFGGVGLGGPSMPSSVATQLDVSGTISVIDEVFSVVRADPSNAGLSEHQLADIAWTAVVSARNGFYGLSNQFQFLQSVDLISISNADHFLQAYYVGTGNSLSENPLAAYLLGIIDPAYNIGKAIAQKCGVNFLPTGNAPQSPANFGFWALAGAYAALADSEPGQSASSVVPVWNSPGASIYMISPGAEVSVPLDPPSSVNQYTYQILAGNAFNTVMIPESSAPPGNILLTYATSSVALLPSETYTFTPPVDHFELQGLAGANSPFSAVSSFSQGGIEVVAQIAPPSIIPSTEVSVTASGLAYSRVNKTYNGTATVTNVSGTTVKGPFLLVFTKLNGDATVLNGTGTLYDGDQYLSIPNIITLAPGQSTTVSVEFYSPSNNKITFTPAIYVGGVS